jgi:GNAT superfamily N-acetyltransferase
MTIEVIITHILSEAQKQAALRLWNNEYPHQLAYGNIRELDEYLDRLEQPTHYLALDRGNIVGWLFIFNRNDERWFAIIIDSTVHRHGIGSGLLQHAKQQYPILNGWVADHNNDVKSNGEPYMSPLQFYMKNGFEVLHGNRLETDHLSLVKIRWTATLIHP